MTKSWTIDPFIIQSTREQLGIRDPSVRVHGFELQAKVELGASALMPPNQNVYVQLNELCGRTER
jgi:hypothetical protein